MAVTSSKQNIFMPQETHDNPFDITLVVEDGTEFKAHRKVLSEASFFFEKLLNSGMMESKKGVVRLEMLTEAGLGAVLEFIYTGDVQILTEDDARDLIEIADYLFILPLKTLAWKVLAKMLNTSNCISAYYVAGRHQCEELVSDAKTFIHAHFTNVAKAEEFLNMSSEDVKQWISSDEINVSAEEDVFKIILTWIDHNKSEREKYFADLFRQVRLIYISRDYLLNDIVTNDLVNGNACCLELVKDALNAVDSKYSENVSFPSPRKSLETPVIVVCLHNRNLCKELMCYAPRTNTWYKLSDTSPPMEQMVSCHGTLYTFVESVTQERDCRLLRYDSFFDRWTKVTFKGKRNLQQIFANDSDNNEDGIYALESENETSCPDCVSLHSCSGPERVSEFSPCGKQHLSYITRYKPESDSWEDIAAFDLGLRTDICIVAKDNFIYFIGGAIRGTDNALTDVDRYDLSERKWEKLANLREARARASGNAVPGKIFIAGGRLRATTSFHYTGAYAKTCEMYNETTNEWHLMAKSRRSPIGSIMCVEDKVYLVDDTWFTWGGRGEIESYDPEKDEWNVITRIALPALLHKRMADFSVISCSVRVFVGSNLHWTQVRL
ncbi:kelch repeat and BTB domain-containing protein 12-like [Oculina patagonica]